MYRWIAFVGMITLWQVLSSLHILPLNKFSSPVSVVIAIKDLWIVGLPSGHKLSIHILYSLLRVMVGYLFAVVSAIPLGLIIGWIKPIQFVIEPIIGIIRHFPPLAWIPLSILWFGIGIKSAAFIIFLGAFFPILLNTIAGVTMLDPIYKDVRKVFGFNKIHMFFKILMPGSIPHIFTGLRIGMGIAWMTLVAAEFTGVKEGYGLGYMIMVARDIQKVDKIIAGMFIIGFIGIFIDHLFNTIERRFFPWIGS